MFGFEVTLYLNPAPNFFEIPLYVIGSAYKVLVFEEVIIDNGVVKVLLKAPDSLWLNTVPLYNARENLDHFLGQPKIKNAV